MIFQFLTVPTYKNNYYHLQTCLYGLGVTVKSCAGVKYLDPLSISDGEALDILVQSFLYVNPDKRPDLETAVEV